VQPQDLAVLQYTGGTTGVSKGAMLTHANLLSNIDQVRAMGKLHMGPDECVLTALPLYHIFAFTANLLCFFDIGGRNILMPSPRPVQNLQRAIENYPITWITGVNTLFNGLMNEEWFTAFPPKTPEGGHCRRHGAAPCGGRALAADHRHPHRRRLRPDRVLAGGELQPAERHAKPRQHRHAGARHRGAPGGRRRRSPVADGRAGRADRARPADHEGLLAAPDETAKVLRDGWLYTGDVAVMDAEGYFKIVDRKKDLVLVSGFNVYPNEVEDALAKMDAVLEAAVVGVPDARAGEAVRAYVVKNPDDGRAHAPCSRTASTLLTDYKIPKSVVFRDELPKTPIGKILRKDLKAEVKAEFQSKATHVAVPQS
jgi:long-chain acyl-CoA synthetase